MRKADLCEERAAAMCPWSGHLNCSIAIHVEAGQNDDVAVNGE
jgi:hypothetical protein